MTRSVQIACVVSFALAGLTISYKVHAQPHDVPGQHWAPPHLQHEKRPPHERRPGQHPDAQRPQQIERDGPDALPDTRAFGGDEEEQRSFDGHMTPEERRLLRQHIEDAVRDLYHH